MHTEVAGGEQTLTDGGSRGTQEVHPYFLENWQAMEGRLCNLVPHESVSR